MLVLAFGKFIEELAVSFTDALSRGTRIDNGIVMPGKSSNPIVGRACIVCVTRKLISKPGISRPRAKGSTMRRGVCESRFVF